MESLCMDPCELLCIIPKPFQPLPTVTEKTLPPRYYSNIPEDLMLKLVTKGKRSKDVVYLPEKLATKLKGFKPKAKSEQLIKLRTSCPGVYSLDDDSLKLDNINAIYGLLSSPLTNDVSLNPNKLKYLALECGPGSHVKTIQLLLPNSRGLGMTNKSRKEWNLSKLNTDRFTPLSGDNMTGDTVTNWKWLINYVNNIMPNMDFIISNSKSEDEMLAHATIALSTLYNREDSVIEVQEQIDVDTKDDEIEDGMISRQITQTTLGGNMAMRLDDITPFIGEIIYLISLCFEWITIFKPITTEPTSSEKYLICFNCKTNSDVLDILVQAMEKGPSKVTSLVPDIPDDFTIWLTNCNTVYVKRQLEYKDVKYDLNRLLLILGMAGTVELGQK